MESLREPRIGRMPRWQRWTTYALVGAAFGSGLGYLVAMDVVETSPDALSRWWIAHGTTGLASLVAIGGAATGHVVATWRSGSGRVFGATNAALLAVLAATALALFYGPQRLHASASTVHWAVGLAALVVFPAHIVHGRRRRNAARSTKAAAGANRRLAATGPVTSSRPPGRRSARTSSD